MKMSDVSETNSVTELFPVWSTEWGTISRITQQSTNQIKCDAVDSHGMPAYYITKGKCVILNHSSFNPTNTHVETPNYRSGTHKDARDLKRCLESLNFDVITWHNYTKLQIEQEMKM